MHRTIRENYNSCYEHTFKEVNHMKRRLCFLMAVLMMTGSTPVIAEEGNFLNSAGKFFGDTWNSVSGAASDAWDTASEAAGNALDTAGEAIGQAWTDVSGAAIDAWGKAGVYLGEKSDEFSVWMTISGNDALEKLKEIYDETAAECLHKIPVGPVDDLPAAVLAGGDAGILEWLAADRPALSSYACFGGGAVFQSA